MLWKVKIWYICPAPMVTCFNKCFVKAFTFSKVINLKIYKFTINYTFLHILFKEFDGKCVTALLKIVSRWLLLMATILGEYCWIPVSQRKLWRFFISKVKKCCIHFIFTKHFNEKHMHKEKVTKSISFW